MGCVVGSRELSWVGGVGLASWKAVGRCRDGSAEISILQGDLEIGGAFFVREPGGLADWWLVAGACGAWLVIGPGRLIVGSVGDSVWVDG